MERFIDCLGSTFDYEILLVVNSSTDGSSDICKKLAEKQPRIRTVVEEKGGWGRAVLLGVSMARGRFICFTNSARTNPAELAPFLTLAEQNPDAIVKAVRKRELGPARIVGSAIYNGINTLLFGIHTPDINGTPKVMSRATVARLELSEIGDLLDLELVIAGARKGIPILNHPIEDTRRHGGRSTTSMKSAVRMYWGSIRYWMGSKT